MESDALEELGPLLRRRSRDGLEVVREPDVCVPALVAIVEVQERSRAEVEGGMNLALVAQAVDLAKCGYQGFVGRNGFVLRRSHGQR